MQVTLKELSDKYKKSNFKNQLAIIVELMKTIVKVMDKSKVIEDC